jgi:hypothetical protein
VRTARNGLTIGARGVLVVGSLAILGAVGRQRRWGQCRCRGTQTVGAVDKAQAQVNATEAAETRALAVNLDAYFRDRCHSGEGAHLQANIERCSQLTAGENATLVVDDFVYDAFRCAVSFRSELSKGRPYTSGSCGRAKWRESASRGDRRARHHGVGWRNRQRLRSHRAERSRAARQSITACRERSRSASSALTSDTWLLLQDELLRLFASVTVPPLEETAP